MTWKSQNFAYPVYLVGRTNIALVQDAGELSDYESWIIFDKSCPRHDPANEMHPFDANCVLLSLRDLGFGRSYTIELFIDTTLDHRSDPLVMRLLLVSLLGVRQLDGLPEGYRDFSFDSLLALALKLCPD